MLSYSYRIDGTFITRTPVVAGQGCFRTGARMGCRGSTIDSDATGDISYLGNAFAVSGSPARRVAGPAHPRKS